MSRRARDPLTKARGFHIWKLIVFSLLGVVVVFHVWALWRVKGQKYELTSKDYYQKEIGFQSELEANSRAEKFAWTLDFDAASGRLKLDLRNNQGVPPLVERGRVELYRPNDASSDFFRPLSSAGEGRFAAEVGSLATGAWNLTLRLETSEGLLIYKSRIQAP